MVLASFTGTSRATPRRCAARNASASLSSCGGTTGVGNSVTPRMNDSEKFDGNERQASDTNTTFGTLQKRDCSMLAVKSTASLGLCDALDSSQVSDWPLSRPCPLK